MNPVERYQCSKCRTTHEREHSAETCCPSMATKVLQCSICQKTYGENDKSKAMKCCPIVEDLSRCLCGAALSIADEKQSSILGSVKYCQPCRIRILNGASSSEAIVSSFRERVT